MEFLSRHKKAFVISVCLVSLMVIIFTRSSLYRPTFFADTLGFIITPVQKAVGGIGDWVGDKIYFLNHISEVEQENIRLKEEIDLLMFEQNRYQRMEEEYQKLSALLEIGEKYASYPTVGAEIIGIDPNNWYDTYIIDKGTRHGLKEEMVVLASGGLVGTITESFYSYSKVIPLVDDASSVSAKSIRTEDIGMVRGDSTLPDGLCRMEYIDIDAEITEGDEIVTSHMGHIYPPGITIGIVQDIQPNADGLTKYALIKPTVDFKHLETVLVINKTFGIEDEPEPEVSN